MAAANLIPHNSHLITHNSAPRIMTSFQKVLIIYLVVINVITFIVYGLDKWKARHSQWRISEAMLLGLAVIGGSIGALSGMQVWRHKTKNKKFKYGVPLILLAQIFLASLTSL